MHIIPSLLSPSPLLLLGKPTTMGRCCGLPAWLAVLLLSLLPTVIHFATRIEYPQPDFGQCVQVMPAQQSGIEHTHAHAHTRSRPGDAIVITGASSGIGLVRMNALLFTFQG